MQVGFLCGCHAGMPQPPYYACNGYPCKQKHRSVGMPQTMYRDDRDLGPVAVPFQNIVDGGIVGVFLEHENRLMQRRSRSRLYPAQTGAWTPAPSARCGAATIMWSCTADPTIPPYRERSPLRNIRQRALHITTWRYNFAAKLEIPTRRHLLHPFRGEHRLGTAR